MDEALNSAVLFDIVPETEFHHARLTSGLFVYDEVLVHGRLISRYWSSYGAIYPDMHYRNWYSQSAPLLDAESFIVAIDGQTLNDGWEWVDASEQADDSGFRGEGRPVRHTVIRLRHQRQPIELAIHTRIDGSPFMIRWLEISNLSDKAVAISALSPWSGLVWNHAYQEHLPPDAPSLFEVAYNHLDLWGEEGDLWWEPVHPGTLSYDGGRRGKSGWSRPAFIARNRANGEVLWVELGWSGQWQMDLTCHQEQKANRSQLHFSIGPAAKDPALRVMDPGEMVKSPSVHIALFHTDIDHCVQAAHDHVRHVIMPAQLPGRHQRIEANHRGYICDRESEEGILREIDMAVEVGAEIFVIDAGWFGPDPNDWQRNVGDWYAGSWLPNDLYPIVDYAHQRGLLFGLWLEIESVGHAALLRQKHPEWVQSRNGAPVGTDRGLDLSNPEVAAWIEAEIDRVITQYKLDLFRLDYNVQLPEGGNRHHQGFVENTLWRHCEALYGIFDRVRAKFPHVIFENCASGGGRLDWEILRRFQITEISDWMRAPRTLRIFNGLSHSLPPEICLRTFGTEVGQHVLEGDVDYQLRCVIIGQPIFRGISPTLGEFNPLFRKRILHATKLYKDFIRPILPECRVFHHTGMMPIYGFAPWCVLEYAAKDRKSAVVALFRTSDMGDDTYKIKARGLNAGHTYRVTFDNSGDSIEVAGAKLMQDGIDIRLTTQLTSELLLIEAL